MKFNPIYQLPEEIPIFNFYMSEENLGYLQKNGLEFNKVRKGKLLKKQLEFKEYFAKKTQTGVYQYNLFKMMNTAKYDIKIEALKTIKEAFQNFGVRNKTTKGLDLDYLKKLGVKQKEKVSDQIKEIDRVKSILESQKATIKLPKGSNEKSDWVKQVVMIGRVLEQKINAKETTLAEWCEYINLANKLSLKK